MFTILLYMQENYIKYNRYIHAPENSLLRITHAQPFAASTCLKLLNTNNNAAETIVIWKGSGFNYLPIKK